MALSESLAILPLVEPIDGAGAAKVSDAVDLSKYNEVTLVLIFGAITGNSILTVYNDSTAALATALTTAIPFKYRFGAADFKATLADTYGDATAVESTGLTLTAATFDHRTILIDIDPATLSDRYLAVNIDATANPILQAGILIGKPRHAGHTQPTAI